MAFPCNQFANEEPGTDSEIAEFVKKYNFKGDLTQKIEVNGENANPLWMWLKKEKNELGNEIKWNFTKFVIDKNGKVVAREPYTTPSIQLVPLIKQLLD